MSVLRLVTILIVTTAGVVFAWSVGVPARALVWGAVAVAGLLVVLTWLTGRHVPPTGIGGQPLQAGDLVPTPSGEWVAYLSPGAKAANAAALAIYAAAGAFLAVYHPVPGATALWDQHTSGVFEPVPWLLWVPAVMIWVALAWVIAGYWLWPYLLDDLAHRVVLRELGDKAETLLSAAAGLFAAPIIIPVYASRLPVPTWAKTVLVAGVLGAAAVVIITWARRPVTDRKPATVLPRPEQATVTHTGRDAA